MKKMLKRADGSYSQRGLWDNIRANKGSGNPPTKEMLEQEAKIKSKKYGDGGPEDPPRKKGALRRLLGIKSGFSPQYIAPGSAAAQERNKQGCTSPECRDKMGGRDAAAWTRNGGGSMGGMDTQSGQKPPPLEVMGRADADKANFLEDARYPDKLVIDPKTGEKTIIQDRSKPYNFFQRMGNRFRGYEKTDLGGATMGGKNMEYIDPNSPSLIATNTNEQPSLGPMKWTPMTYTPDTTIGNQKIEPAQYGDRNYPEGPPSLKAMKPTPKFNINDTLPKFKKGGVKNKSFIEDSKELMFGGVSNKRKKGKY
jgi:hypothetical protein